jgi:hypothetical protein
MLMGYTADFTTIDLKVMHQLFITSEWNPRDLGETIGTAQGNFTIFCPLSDGFGDLTPEIIGRFSTLFWRRHLRSLLLHMITEPALTTEQWYERVEQAGGQLSVEMLSGFNISFVIDANSYELLVDGSPLTTSSVLKGIDG